MSHPNVSRVIGTSSLFKRDDGSLDQEAKTAIFAKRASSAALGKIGEPSDIAWAVLYLASDASKFMTGQIVRPNGGSIMG